MWVVNEISCTDGLEIKRQWICEDYEEALGQAVHVIITEHDLTLSHQKCREVFEERNGWWNGSMEFAVLLSQPEK